MVTRPLSVALAQSAPIRFGASFDAFAKQAQDVVPHSFFGFVHDKCRTPALNIIAIGVIGLLALKSDPATSTSYINFGAFLML